MIIPESEYDDYWLDSLYDDEASLVDDEVLFWDSINQEFYYDGLALPRRAVAKLPGHGGFWVYCTPKHRQDTKRGGHRRMRQAVRAALRGNHKQAQRFQPVTRWHID